MTRRSVTGPLLLILIGGLFLVHNLRPELAAFDLAARYWPFALIAWGFLRLVEIVSWRLSSRPLPAAGITGGEWALVILVCLIGSGLSTLHRHGPRLPPMMIGGRTVDLFGDPHDFPVSAAKPAENVTRVVIQNLRGNVRVVGEDTSEVKVEGRNTVRAFQFSEAEKANLMAPLELVRRGDQLVVQTNHEAVSGERRISSDLEIVVPRRVHLQARGQIGDYDILNIDGNVEIESSTAEVRLHDIGGNARIDVRRSGTVRMVNIKGNLEIIGRGRDVELENIEGEVLINGRYSGDLYCRNLARPVRFESGTTEMRAEGIPGELRMDLGNLSAAKVTGPFRLVARSRDVRIEEFTGDLTLSVDRGDIEVRPGRSPSNPLEITTRSGNVDLRLPADARFELRAVTRRGEVVNDFGPALEVKPEERGATLSGVVGKGPKIEITTERGTIKVRKE